MPLSSSSSSIFGPLEPPLAVTLINLESVLNLVGSKMDCMVAEGSSPQIQDYDATGWSSALKHIQMAWTVLHSEGWVQSLLVSIQDHIAKVGSLTIQVSLNLQKAGLQGSRNQDSDSSDLGELNGGSH